MICARQVRIVQRGSADGLRVESASVPVSALSGRCVRGELRGCAVLHRRRVVRGIQGVPWFPEAGRVLVGFLAALDSNSMTHYPLVRETFVFVLLPNTYGPSVSIVSMLRTVSTYKKEHHLDRSVGFRLTCDQFILLAQAAENAEVSVAEMSRRLVLLGLTSPYESLLQMQFSAIGEERIRLMFEAAQKGQKVTVPETQKRIEEEATIAAIELTANRISVLEQLRSRRLSETHSDAE